jgi:O-antigen biosynthesis protein WbqP
MHGTLSHGTNIVITNNAVNQYVKGHYAPVKRIIDVCVSFVMLILLSPVLLLTGIAVKLTSKGPALYWSDRRGLNGEVFSMPKLRTMTICSKEISREVATDNDIRFTPIGRFLRKTSLDELPQLWSVLTGEMSLVGPRPLIVADQAEKARFQKSGIYDVKPGITGLAQINGRSFISVENKARYDAFYASRICLFLDFKILMKTALILFKTKLVK